MTPPAPTAPPDAIVPVSRMRVSVRPATMDDFPFIDGLQKMHTKQVGWMPEKALRGKIAANQVIVAWAAGPCSSSEETNTGQRPVPREDSEETNTGQRPVPREEPLGYCIGQDQYFKRDDIGIIYQMNIVPAKQRGLIGATLVRAMFERAAYGCRLFCCWCAQDIEANYFWESLGFVPLAFRAGSRAKDRVHIFWQRRIREGDVSTPYWFPAQTSAGSIREDRLVLPIPPGTSWKDVMPRILPKEKKMLESEAKPTAQPTSPAQPKMPKRRFVQFGPPPSGPTQNAETVVVNAKPAPKPKKPKQKNDPKHVAAARELRDRWLERFNSGLVLPEGKYQVAVALPAPCASSGPAKALPLAA